jgi:outer membrane protein assembly factor BamD
VGRAVLAVRALVLLLALVVLPEACARGRAFNPRKVATTTELFRQSEAQFRRKKWDNALAGFDLLASQLPSRDTLLPRVYFFQGQAHSRKGEHLLAAQAYSRIQDAFPDDSLADRALFEQGMAYRKLWRRPALTPENGQTAIATFRQLVSSYPDSPLLARAEQQILDLNTQLAAKDYETGMHYYRRKAWDSALIYFKDVVKNYPGTWPAHDSYLRMVEAYQAINYKEDVTETCANARAAYPNDARVARLCGPAAGNPAATAAGPATPAAPQL